MLRPTMSYRAIELDVPGGWLGVIASSFAVVPLILAVPIGQIADRYGEHRVARAGSGLFILCAGCFTFLGQSVPGVVLGGVLLGAGHLGCVVGQQALVANTTDRGRFDTAFGHYTFVASIGQAAGPVLISAAGRAGPIPDTQLIFWWACGLSVLLTLCALPLAGSAQDSVVRRGAHDGLGVLIRRPGLIRALLTSCIVLSAVDITLVYLPALGAERGLAAGTVGALLAARGIASMVSRLFVGRLSSLVGRRRLLVTSTVAAAVALMSTPAPVPVWVLGVLLAVAGFGLGVGQPLTMSWLAEAAPPGQRGRAMSLRLMGNRTGQVIIPSAAGVVAAGLGAAGVLWATALGLGWAGVAARRLPLDQ